MKSSFVKIAVPTLALGLAFAPIANAAPNDACHNKVVSKTTETKAKEVVKKQTAKEKEAVKKLASITKNISKVEASIPQLSTATVNFYAKAAATPVSAKVEADFYASTSGKLNANSNQLRALKKQIDHVAKAYKDTSAVVEANKKITDLNTAISEAGKKLTDLHNQFKASVKEQEAKKQLTSINETISKVEASVAELTKATADFYTKATADPAVTVQAEADFYSKTSDAILANTKQLLVLMGQVNGYAKKYGTSADVTAAYSKIAAQTKAVGTAVEALNNSHASFKPVQPTTTNP